MSTTPMARNTGAPRWQVLLGLAAGVLLVHLWLLVGPWPVLTSHSSVVASTSTGDAGLRSAAQGGPGATPLPAPQVLPVQISAVRWITPPPPTPALPARAPVSPPGPLPAPTHTEPEPAPAPSAVVAGKTPEAPPVPASEPVGTPTGTATPTTPTVAVATSDSVTGSGAAAAPGGGQPLPPVQTVRDTVLNYDVEGLIKNIPFHAQGTLQWHREDNRYDARMELKAFLVGSRVQTSSGLIGPDGLLPERFADRSRSEKAAHFDRANGRIRFSNNAPDAPLLPGAQDRLSIFMQLAARLDARPQDYPPGTTFDIQVVGAGSAESWRFVVESPVQDLNLPAGELPAIKLYRPPRQEYDTALEIWLAPQLHYLPARIRLTQSNGDVADQQLNFVPRVERSP